MSQRTLPPADLARAALHRVKMADKLWGHALIGCALFYAYYRDERYLSSLEVGDLAGVSDDTARRHLERLRRVNRVDCTMPDRVRLYRATDAMAARSMEILLEVPS